jgi:nucleoside-diphosphate-sugar epimerase
MDETEDLDFGVLDVAFADEAFGQLRPIVSPGPGVRSMKPPRKPIPMRIFLTGATGFIGSHVVPLLLEAGHQVLGLTRSDSGEKQLQDAGAEPYRGDLDDPSTLRRGAEKADAVIHCAFDHDFSRFVENCEKDRRNIEAIGEALVGSKRPFIITSGVGMGSGGPGQIATEGVFNADNPHPRKMSELAGNALLARGLHVSYVRLPQVHDTKKQGLVTPLVAIAREKGRVAYVGEGKNRLAATHVSDVARLYKLAVEHDEPGARFNAIAEEGVPMKDIAEAIGRSLKLPVVSVTGTDATDYFGWMMMFAGVDIVGSSAITQKKLGWKPTGRGLVADLDHLEV